MFATENPMISQPRLKLRPDEQSFYQKCFDSLSNKSTNHVEGKSSLEFFRSSKLGGDILKSIWGIAAKTDSMSLNQAEFYTALRLIAMAQSGKNYLDEFNALNSQDCQLPKFAVLSNSSEPPKTNISMSSQKASITLEEFKNCCEMFEKVDKNKMGKISGEQLTSMFKKTNLPPPILNKIWTLAEPNSEGFYEKPNVIILLYYLVKAFTGNDPPMQIPGEMKSEVNRFLSQSQQKTTPQLSNHVPRNDLSDPFAEISSDAYKKPTLQPLYSHPQIAAPPPAPVSTPAMPFVFEKNNPAVPNRNLDILKPPPASMHNILPKSSGANRGPKIDPSMRGVLEEQEGEMFNTARSASSDGDTDSSNSKHYFDQLSTMNQERAKLKKTIHMNKLELKKEEEMMAHYQTQINKITDEYIGLVKEFDELMRKRLSNNPQMSFTGPAISPELIKTSAHQQNQPQIIVNQQKVHKRAPSEDKFSSNSPASTIPVATYSLYNKPNLTAQPKPNLTIQTSPSPPNPKIISQQPAFEMKLQPTPQKISPPREESKANTANTAPKWEGFENSFPDNSTNANYNWGTSDFGNTGIMKAETKKEAQDEPEFDFS